MKATLHVRALAAVLACAVSALSATVAVGAHEREAQKSGASDSRRDRSSSDRRSDHPRVKWWEDAKWRAEIGISTAQAAQIKEIFDSTMVQLRADRAELERREIALSQTIKDERSDIVDVTQQVDRVENLRAQMQKARVLMIYRMHRVLSAEQRARLESMYERLQAERRQNDPKRH